MSLFTLIGSRYEVEARRVTRTEDEFPLQEVQVYSWCRHPFFKDEQVVTESGKPYHGECHEQWIAHWDEIDRIFGF
jgi:hypothetical protein